MTLSNTFASCEAYQLVGELQYTVKKKQIGLLFLTIALILSLFTPNAMAADDLTGHRYEHEMRELISLGIINGYGNGIYKPDQNVTRAEFAKFVVLSFELASEGEEPGSLSIASTPVDISTFKDVKETDWFASVVNDAVLAGIINGFPDGTFKPNALITREQMASMLSRALTAKGLVSEDIKLDPLKFKDAAKINSSHLKDVQLAAMFDLLRGDDLGNFNPKGETTRWMVALVMIRGRDFVFPDVQRSFQVSDVQSGSLVYKADFNSFDQAKTYANAHSNYVVTQNSIILWMKNGIAVSNKLANVFPASDLKWSNVGRGTQFRPYVTTLSEMKYLDATLTAVKVEVAGKVGYVDPTAVRLIPSTMQEGRSYYSRIDVNGQPRLVHHLFNYNTAKTYSSTGVIGIAPSGMQLNTRYYSWDGVTFYNAAGNKVAEQAQYFNKLQLRTKTNYTAAELDKFLADQFPFYNRTAGGKVWTTSPLVGIGKDVKEVEEAYQVNALYLLAHAIHESGWGTSKIAQDKFNLFGYGAVDSDPYRGAYTYPNFKASVEDAAKRVTANYQQVSGSFYNGSFLGNKALGMNVRYASDPFWGEKIAGHMFRADDYLGKKDIFKENLFETVVANTNFRSSGGVTGTNLLYTMPEPGLPVVAPGVTSISPTTWYRVVSEQRLYPEAFVRGDLIRPIPLAGK